MTSVYAAPAQIPANKLYTNIVNAASTITDTLGNVVPWATNPTTQAGSNVLGLLSTPGAAVLRDLGKTVYQPNPVNYNLLGSVSTIYRKVQLVTPGALGYYGTGGDATYYTGYIPLGGVTYGGGSGVAGGWVRLN